MSRRGEQQRRSWTSAGRAHSREGEEGQQELREDAGGSSPHHKISLSDDGDTGFPLLKHEVTRVKAEKQGLGGSALVAA